MHFLRQGFLALLIMAVLAPVAAAQTPAPARPGPPPERTHAGLVAARAASSVPLQAELNRGFPEFVAGRFTVTGSTAGARAQSFVSRFASLYGQQFDRDLRMSLRRAATIGAVLGQTYRGVPVHGARLSVFTVGNQVFGTVGRLSTTLRLDTNPAITAKAATDALRAALGRSSAKLLGEPRLVVFDPALTEGAQGPARPAYEISIDGDPPLTALVDGLNGQILSQYPHELEAYSMSLSDANQKKPGEDQCYDDLSGIDLAATHAGVKSAYSNDGDVKTAKLALDNAYNVFKNLLGRKSFDGLDSPLVAYVHANTSNARWSWGCTDMAARDTVVTNDVWLHELAHGVTQFTSGLAYRFQSGALNESFSDTMAAASDQDWLIDGGSALGVIRDMSDPPSKGMPAHPGHWSGYLTLPDTKAGDYGGVHFNSGIPNKARHLMAVGGQNQHEPGTKHIVPGFGRAKMAKVAYIGNLLLGPDATFAEAAGAELIGTAVYSLIQPAYGLSVGDMCTVRNAWAAVGVLMTGYDGDCDGKSDNSDGDRDGDGVNNATDNCPDFKSPNLSDIDGDKQGDVCDSDDDGDGVEDGTDNCNKPNPNQADGNGNGKGDVCEDLDGDGVLDNLDNCVEDHNPSQTDTNSDGEGDACEADNDGDGVIDDDDKCQFVAGGGEDSDKDGLGNACDPCPNGFDVVVAYTTGNKALGTKPKPILKDSDEDGKPDGCESVRGSAVLQASGNKLRPIAAIRPGTGKLILRGKKGTTFRMPLRPCTGKPCAALFNKGGLVQVAIGALRSGVGVRLIDDFGTKVAVPRLGNRGALVLRFRPQADRQYFLEGRVGRTLAKKGEPFAVKVQAAG